MQTLHTLNKLHAERLPKDTVSFNQFKEIIAQLGTYKLIGKTMLMTDRDWHDFLDAVAAQRTRPTAPRPHEPGLLVLIGHPLENDALIFIGWAPVGQELVLLDRVTEGAQERVMVLETSHATPHEVAMFRAKHKKSWRFGYWHGRTEALMEDIAAITAATNAAIEAEESEVPIEHATEAVTTAS